MSDPKRSDPFGELFGDFSVRLRGDRWQPDVDVVETEDEVVVRVELAGVHSRDLRVGVDGSELCISGQRVAAESSGVRRLHQMEIATGPFERRLRIPVGFDRERVSAHLADGILTIQLPKRGRRSVAVERG
ncbi:MAG TPA: Hsp20/alpha crystallin family protein [Myxococcota bacterium]|nr:Hsp20/alpha crystallin family protein [Myxococcota bacterium]